MIFGPRDGFLIKGAIIECYKLSGKVPVDHHHSAAKQVTTNFLHSLRSWAKEAIASGFR